MYRSLQGRELEKNKRSDWRGDLLVAIEKRGSMVKLFRGARGVYIIYTGRKQDKYVHMHVAKIPQITQALSYAGTED
jgi:hypothetical protein